MKVLLKLFNMLKPAADGSTIPRTSVEQYLASDDYKTIIADKIALGGVTHKDRKVQDKYDGLVGPDDQILISSNATHYIEKIFLNPDDPEYCYAIVQVLDPEKYEGERKANIKNLIADLESGVKLPCSVVIQALWSYENVAEKIIRIKGVDFTINPSFEGSGTVKVFSSIEPKEVPSTEIFSNSEDAKNLEGCTLKTVVFSTVAEVIKDNDTEGEPVKTFSLKEIQKMYGITSLIYDRTKNNGGTITQKEIDDINNVPNQLVTNSEKSNIEFIKRVLQDRGIIGDDVKTIILKYGDELDNIINAADKTNEEEVIADINDFFELHPETIEFSTSSSIKDRMFFMKFPNITLAARILNSYKKYVEQKENMTDEEKEWVQVLIAQDVNILLRNAAPKILKGTNLKTIYGLMQFNEDIASAGEKFSRIYRQVILSEQILGFIPTQKYARFKEALKEFMDAIMIYCIGEPATIGLTTIENSVKL